MLYSVLVALFILFTHFNVTINLDLLTYHGNIVQPKVKQTIPQKCVKGKPRVKGT